jgi:DNA-binding response OmpR family regulator
MHLLVVEDDERLSRALRRLLEEDRHVVDVASDGETGLAIAEDGAGIEAVILDIGLPDISGLEVARRLRRKRSELAILMLTARDTVGDRVTGLDAGADDYLVKPFAYEELARGCGRCRDGPRAPAGRPRS